MNKEVCSGCRRSRAIQNKNKNLCSECVFKLSHSGMDRVTYYRSRTTTKKRKKTGERDLFLKIWEEREHVCVKCERWLGDEPRAHFFSHITSKGANAAKRLDPENIEILCLECHQREEFGDRRQGNL